jgi:hypothetical protein
MRQIPAMINVAPIDCQPVTVSLRNSTPVNIVPITNDPAAIGNANESGNILRITIHMTAPPAYRVNPIAKAIDFHVSADLIKNSPVQLTAM